jgi:hypothetical protein
MNSKRPAFFCLFYFLTQFIFSQIGGNSAYEFLNLPFSAREAAAGGTLITVKDDDINLTFHNPALISEGMDNHFALSYVDYIADINYGYAAYSKTFANVGSFVIGMQYVNYGKFIEADPTGLITGSFTAADYSFNVGYCRQLDSMFSVGATLKTIYSNLDTYTSLGSAADLGATYSNPHNLFTASAVVSGIGYQWMTYSNGDQEPIPFEIQLGISKRLKKAPFRFSLIYQHLEKWDLTYVDPTDPNTTINPLTGTTTSHGPDNNFFYKLGLHMVGSAEILIGKNFAIRVGYNYERQQELKILGQSSIAGFSGGFGFKISKFNFSYSYAQYSPAGASNTFTVTSGLSEFYRRQ